MPEKSIVLLIGVLLVCTALASANIIYVDHEKYGGDGSSWAKAFRTVKQAALTAQIGDEVWVKTGTYAEAGIEITKDFAIYGGFSGTETSLDRRDHVLNVTVLDGRGLSPSVVIMTTGRLDGFTILGGKGTNRTYKDVYRPFGGAVLVDFNAVDVIITNCIIRESECGSPETGLAVAAFHTNTLYIENCRIEEVRRPAGEGGLLLGTNSRLVMRNTTISNNDGPGLYCEENNNVLIEDCNFSKNEYAGAWMLGSNMDIRRCRFSENNARGLELLSGCSGLMTSCEISSNTMDVAIGVYGAGLLIHHESEVTLYDCTISNNRRNQTDAAAGGGVCISGKSRVSLLKCKISNNQLIYGDSIRCVGGGAHISGGSKVNFINCQIMRNRSYFRAALSVEGPDTTVLIHGCILSGNVPDSTSCITSDIDSDLLIVNTLSINNITLPDITKISVPPQANVNISNSILWNNGREITLGNDATATVDHTCITDGWEGEGNISADPMVIDPGSMVQNPDGSWAWTEGFYMLQSKALGFPGDSPCIDAGNPDPKYNDAARPPGQGTERCDMGPFGGPQNAAWKFYMVEPIINHILGRHPGYPLDANNDGRVDVSDIIDCLSYVPPLP